MIALCAPAVFRKRVIERRQGLHEGLVEQRVELGDDDAQPVLAGRAKLACPGPWPAALRFGHRPG
jgi:hypothetical protein